MKIIKQFTKEGWLPLYINALKKALFAENNLSDIHDKAEARKNLELTGDNVNTHYHDDRYKPMIQAAADKVENKLDDIQRDVLVQINEIKETLKENENNADNKVDKSFFVVSDTKPGLVKEGLVWFCSDSAAPHIEIYSSGQWIKVGGVWK